MPTNELKASDVFDPKDFDSIELLIYFKNFSTQTEVKNTDAVRLTELGVKLMKLDLPPRSCNFNHNVTIEIKIKKSFQSAPENLITVTGKITDITEVHDRFGDVESLQVTVYCVQYDEESWYKLEKMFQVRQDEINALFSRANGD